MIAENLVDVDYLSRLASNSISAYLDTWLLVAQYHGVDTSGWDEGHSFYPRPAPDESARVARGQPARAGRPPVLARNP